jgi:YggT family protein
VRFLFSILRSFTSLYSILIFIRVMLTWFSGVSDNRAAGLLSRATDPYLNWFRRFPALRAGFLDLSPVAAIAVLSLVNRVFTILAYTGRISLGIILALILSALWSAASFVLGFCALVLGLRLIAYISSRNINSLFWHIVDTISRPILYRINRILFRGRIVNYLTELLVSIAVLLGALIIAGGLVRWGVVYLSALPF